MDRPGLPFVLGDVVYANPLASERDLAAWRLEGAAVLGFPESRLRMENARPPEEGQEANFVLWCPQELPDGVAVSWEVRPLREPGLCMLFFAARGRAGEDLFDPRLAPRSGPYRQYHHGDINALHVSYFRRKAPSERAFHTCNLRKSHGFHLVAQGADPLPGADDMTAPYRMLLIKCGPLVAFAINDLPIFQWVDDGTSYGPVLGGGKIGLRQMAPLQAEYANLEVRRARPEAGP